MYKHLDVSDEANWQAVVADVIREFGRLDVLVNNAGIGTLPDVETETRDGYDKTIAVNQTGVWLGMKTSVPEMRKGGGGSIVNVSSIFGAVGGFGGSVAYHATKGAVRLMTKNAALHWGKRGVRVNSVHPGFIETPRSRQLWQGTSRYTAMVDGTTRFGAFVRILLPLVGPGLVATAIFAFVQAWNEFIIAYVFLHSPEKQTLMVWLASFTTLRGTDWGPLMAGATLCALPVVLFFVLVQRKIAFGLTAGAVKS